MPEDRDPADRYVFSRESAIWEFNSQWTGLIYGPAAAILQIAHPSIAHGVARHSDFQNDTLGRLNRTLADVNQIAFGTWTEAEEARSRLFAIHARVRGTSENGVSYNAFDQDLMVWVLATLVIASIGGRELVYGPMSDEEKEALLKDMVRFGTFFGISPDRRLETWEAFESYYRSMIEGNLLGSDPKCGELARILVKPTDSLPSRILGSISGFLPIETLPSRLLEPLSLNSTRSTRARMKLFRSWFPAIFKRLPSRAKYYRRTRARLDGRL